MPNKHEKLNEIRDTNSPLRNPDYCSLCAGYKSKMLNHTVAHKLMARGEHFPAFYNKQDITKPKHLTPSDPRLQNDIQRTKRKNM